ncbi:MAG: hypothetical protein PWQ77_1564 [Kosmotogales bacterium]|nr:hypothetical protein [Kosmotogales bacterium]
MKELLKNITEISSPSGREKNIRKFIIEEIKDYVDDYGVDSLGNLIAVKKGKSGKKLLIDAHMDEIGVVVSHIDDNGFLRIEMIGGVSPYILLGTRLKFLNGIVGVVGYEGESMAESGANIKNLSFDNIFVDVGATSKEEAEEKTPVGSFATYEAEFYDGGKRLISKAFDDRVGCAFMIQLLKEIEKPVDDLYLVFSVQEEVGLVGASVASHDINPDMAIALDISGGPDTPKHFKRMNFKLGGGPLIKIKDKSSISSSYFVDKLTEVAKKNNIPYQYEVLIFGGTNARGYQVKGAGTHAGTISIATRYAHTPHEMIDYDDVLNIVKLLKKLCEEGI